MDIRRQVREFIRSNFYAGDEVRDDESLLDSGILDSTGVLEVVAFLESEYALEVPDADIVPENLETIARVSDYVARRLGALARGATG